MRLLIRDVRVMLERKRRLNVFHLLIETPFSLQHHSLTAFDILAPSMELLTCLQCLPGNVYQLLETVIRRLNVTLASRLEVLTPLFGNSDQIAWPAKPKYARVYYGHVSNMRLLCSD